MRENRVTEVKRVPVEKAFGRKPVGSPPERVNPAPQPQNLPQSQGSNPPSR